MGPDTHMLVNSLTEKRFWMKLAFFNKQQIQAV